MTSKRLFANLLKENTKRRLWPIALSIAANFFAQIVYAVLIMGHYADRLLDQRTTIGEIRIAFFRSVAGLLNVPVLIIVVGMAFVIAMQGYFYLFDSKQTDLYYSLPVKRQKIFDAFNIIGILIFVIPYIICHIITVIMGLTRGYVEVRNLPLFAASALLVILEFLLCYEVCVLAAVLTGHVVVAALGCGVFFFLGPIAGGLKESMMSIFFSSYYSDSSFGAKYFYSPIGLMYNLTNEILAGKDAALRLYAGKALTTLILTVVVTALCFVLSRILINKRPAEAAGKAMAFEITKPVLKVAIMIQCHLL
ncbi:hypothetical protein [Butyrivibrio sp. VCD2006]|uniref:hypothetical protein n=1 Tax=Butyrivibrio sp. VCD2006 TaxID=1280664 RepID=UPI00040148AE|nr:hypothetical protein [Butyrivibrio sp. VCD2006]